MQKDHIDRVLSQWEHERPELDALAMSIFGRIWRLNTLALKAVEKVLLEFGLSQPEFDVLATLRRSGQPYVLSPTELYTSLMLSSGAMTNRLDKLESRELIQRVPSPDDRRSMLVQLTSQGMSVIDATLVAHVANEQQMLNALDTHQQQQLADLLRTLLLHISPEEQQAPSPT